MIQIETEYTKLCIEKTNLESEQARLGRSVSTNPQQVCASSYICGVSDEDMRMPSVAGPVAATRSRQKDD